MFLFDLGMLSVNGLHVTVTVYIVRLYTLHVLGEKYGTHRKSLYRDDRLACF